MLKLSRPLIKQQKFTVTFETLLLEYLEDSKDLFNKLIQVVVYVYLFGRISLCSLGWPGTSCVGQTVSDPPSSAV